MDPKDSGGGALRGLALRMRKELLEDILPWWIPTMDRAGGGFYGLVRNDRSVDPLAPKGLVMHARFLWAYSAAHRLLGGQEWLAAADQAFEFLAGPLRDGAAGGFWWIVDPEGRPLHRDKVVYGQAFALYGLSEYYRASGRREALSLALEVFSLLEGKARDREGGGYFDTMREDWGAPLVKALSEVDIPAEKTMNTNLHVLEALTAFRLATGRDEALEALKAQIAAMADKVFAGKDRMSLYFDRAWTSLKEVVSYGHDVEASWLLAEAAETAYGRAWPAGLRDLVLRAAAASLAALRDHGGSLPGELHGGKLDTARTWWVQAEAVVGMANAWEMTGDAAYLEAATGVWDFIEAEMIDKVHGEWFWAVGPEGFPEAGREKGGLWKTCYHNGRACMEVMRRAGILEEG